MNDGTHAQVPSPRAVISAATSYVPLETEEVTKTSKIMILGGLDCRHRQT
jgi:hypothetical protein